MKTMQPTLVNTQLGLPGNDSKHNKIDLNRGGGPALRNRKSVPPAKRGGFGHQGQRVHLRAAMPGGRPGAGNPAGRGSEPRSMRPDTRNPNTGGGVQQAGDRSAPRGGGFGKPGQVGVPGVRTNPQPSAGNTGGRMARRVAGHFTNKTKGSGGNTGKYGGPPVRLDS